MTPTPRRFGCIGATAALLLAIGLWLHWWMFGTPRRPPGVDASYAFVRIHWDFPVDDGAWISCQRGGRPGTASCTVRRQDGSHPATYTYKTYPLATLLPAGPLRVDPRTTDWSDGVLFFPNGGVGYSPFIHLVGGPVLLPTAAYAQAAIQYRRDSRIRARLRLWP